MRNRVRVFLVSLMSVSIALSATRFAFADEPAVSFDIASQELGAALNEFALQSGKEILFVEAEIAGKSTPGVNGSYAPTEALALLLTDTQLGYSVNELDTVLVGETVDEVSSNSGNSKPVLRSSLMAQMASNQSSTTMSSRSSGDGATSAVSGRVTDARSGANLKGALVTIEELDQSTSTNELGEFRFPSVASGYYTLRVSYLGYVEQTAEVEVLGGESKERDFALVGGSELEEIIVFGQRSARAQALNIERTAPNSRTVLSADMLGNFNGTTISEALRRAPGVAFIPDENTGEGANVIFRGLEPDLNQVTLNGIRLLDGTGLGRAPDLSNILTEAVESVTINRTLLPSDESSGAGAVIEIETKGPLDRDDRFASFGVEYGETGGDFGDEFGVNGTLSGRFGDNRDFGISLSASYRENETTRVNYNVTLPLPAVLPLDENGEATITDPFFIDPRRSFPFEGQFVDLFPSSAGTQQGTAETETLSLSGTLQKLWGQHTELRLDGVYTEDQVSSFTLFTGGGVETSYQRLPIDALGGEERYTIVTEDARPDRFGAGIIGIVSRLARGVPDQQSNTLSLSLRGDTSLSRWDMRYGLGYSRSESENSLSYQVGLGTLSIEPRSYSGLLADRSFLQQGALQNVTSDGRIVSVFAPLTPGDDGFVQPLFNEQGFEFYNTIDNLPVSVSRFGGRQSQSEEYTVDYSLRRAFDRSHLQYIEVGVNYTRADFFSPASFLAENTNTGFGFFAGAAGARPSDFGLEFAPSLQNRVGVEGGFLSLDGGSAAGFVNNLSDLVEAGLLVEVFELPPNDEENSKTAEETLAPYVQGRIDIGKWEVVGGVRLESIEISSTSFVSPFVTSVDNVPLLNSIEFGQFLTDTAKQTELLPRILVNYRLTDNVIFRGGYYVTASRPQLSNLTTERRLNLDLDPLASTTNDRPILRVQQGNPDLKPAIAHNFGLDWEWYFDDVGVIKVAGFYKQIKNPLQVTVVQGGLEALPEDLVLPNIPFYNDLPDPLEVTVSQPVNSEDDDEIWGVELTMERQLAFLPRIFDGLGVYANYTHTDSEGTRRRSVPASIDPRRFVEIDAPIFDAPEHQGTFGLTYNRYSVDATLFYSAQARRLASIGDFGFDVYNEAIETLDFSLDYFHDFGGMTARFFIRGEDLLSGEEAPLLQTTIGGENGVPKYFTGATYFGGRSVFVGVTTTF